MFIFVEERRLLTVHRTECWVQLTIVKVCVSFCTHKTRALLKKSNYVMAGELQGTQHNQEMSFRSVVLEEISESKLISPFYSVFSIRFLFMDHVLF